MAANMHLRLARRCKLPNLFFKLGPIRYTSGAVGRMTSFASDLYYGSRLFSPGELVSERDLAANVSPRAACEP